MDPNVSEVRNAAASWWLTRRGRLGKLPGGLVVAEAGRPATVFFFHLVLCRPLKFSTSTFFSFLLFFPFRLACRYEDYNGQIDQL